MMAIVTGGGNTTKANGVAMGKETAMGTETKIGKETETTIG